jgi:hypothetical protein
MAYPHMFYHFLFESFLFGANAWELEPPTRRLRGKTFRPRCSYYGGTSLCAAIGTQPFPTSTNYRQVAFVAPSCSKLLRLVTTLLPEKFSPLGSRLDRTSG